MKRSTVYLIAAVIFAVMTFFERSYAFALLVVYSNWWHEVRISERLEKRLEAVEQESRKEKR